MFSFTESVEVSVSPEQAWMFMVNIEDWWPPSNPEHESIEILDRGKPLQKGTRIRIREKVAGIPGEATGEISEFVEYDHVTWKSDRARYRLWWQTVVVSEGVRWSLSPVDGGVMISAHVWAVFPGGLLGRCIEWVFKVLLRGESRDRLHARRELEYIKRQVEGG